MSRVDRLGQHLGLADVLVHHAVAQQPHCQPVLARHVEPAQSRRAIEVVEHGTHRLADPREQGR